MTFSIIMPVKGNSSFTRDFFTSFHKNTQSRDYEFIVINNGDDEETHQILEEQSEKISKLSVINNDKNIGVAASWNQGIKEAKGDYICIVNNDIEILTPGWLGFFKKRLDKSTSIYWTSPMTCYSKNNKNRQFRPSHYEQLKYGTDIYSYVVGCCFMCPLKAFEDVGLFDEKFEMKYYEDLDFINRIFSKGKMVSMTHDVLVYHAVGATSRITKGGGGNYDRYKMKWENTNFDILAKQPNKIKGIKHFDQRK